LALSANGTNFRMGEDGIKLPRSDVFGIFLKIL